MPSSRKLTSPGGSTGERRVEAHRSNYALSAPTGRRYSALADPGNPEQTVGWAAR
jgi:hypothetical protein